MMAMKTDLDHDARPLVVVIEDEDDLRELVLYNLRAEGFEAVGAVTAGEGLALCTLRCPEVVIIDRMLHDTDGIALCAHLRDDSEVADGAIMVLSARGAPADLRAGWAAGADDYLVKPFEVGELVRRVRGLASLAERRRVLRASSRR